MKPGWLSVCAAAAGVQGRSWLLPPRDKKKDSDNCYMPKRWIHTWQARPGGVGWGGGGGWIHTWQARPRGQGGGGRLLPSRKLACTRRKLGRRRLAWS